MLLSCFVIIGKVVRVVCSVYYGRIGTKHEFSIFLVAPYAAAYMVVRFLDDLG